MGGKGRGARGEALAHNTHPQQERMEQGKGLADAKGREQKASTDPVDSGSREECEEEDGDVGGEVESRNPIRCGGGGSAGTVQSAGLSIPVRSDRACGLGMDMDTDGTVGMAGLWHSSALHRSGGNCAGAECPLPFSGKESVGGSFFFSTQGQY